MTTNALKEPAARHKELRAQGVPYTEAKETVLREQRVLNGEGKAKRLVVSLSEDDRVALLTLAESRNVSQAEVVRDLIREEAKRGAR